jgi:hypothetical protein
MPAFKTGIAVAMAARANCRRVCAEREVVLHPNEAEELRARNAIITACIELRYSRPRRWM